MGSHVSPALTSHKIQVFVFPGESNKRRMGLPKLASREEEKGRV